MQWEPTSDAADLKARIEAERTGQAFLYWKDVDARQQILLLDPDTDRVTVGRRGDQDIVLDWDKQVSRATRCWRSAAATGRSSTSSPRTAPTSTATASTGASGSTTRT